MANPERHFAHRDFLSPDVLEVFHSVERRVSVKSTYILIIPGHLELIDKPVHTLFYMEGFVRGSSVRLLSG